MRSFSSTYKFFEKRDGRIIVFRRWLESKWAYIFDCLGLEWVYEPAIIQLENNKSYIPDFFIKGIGFFQIFNGKSEMKGGDWSTHRGSN